MADDIPESLSVDEARSIMSDAAHPLHQSWQHGNPTLQERMEAAYRSHYGSEEIGASPPEDPAEQKNQSETDESALRGEFFRQNFDGATEEEVSTGLIKMLDDVSPRYKQEIQRDFPDILQHPSVLKMLWGLRKR